MTKKLFSVVMIISLLFTVLPMSFTASAEADPEGTVIVYNDTATNNGAQFAAYTNPGSSAEQTIYSYGTVQFFTESSLKGPDGTTPALQLTKVGYAAWYMLTAEYDASKAGTYDVYVYNISNISQDKYRGQTTAATPDYSVQYDIVSANGEATYFVDQKNASGGKDGWVKLGTHYFSGSSGERVCVSKNYNGDAGDAVTYLSAVKFVPVNKPSSTKLTHMYMKYNGARVEKEDATINGNTVIKQFSSDYADSSKKISLCFETEDAGAKVKFDWGGEGTGKTGVDFYADPTKTQHYNLTVTSKDGTKTENYSIALGIDSAENAVYYSVGADNYTATYRSATPYSYDDTISNANWKYPDGLTNNKSNIYKLGDMNTWTVTENSVTEGYYSVYVWSTGQNGFMDETVEMTVNHAGLRENCAVTVGNYHLNNAKWAYAGSYYFNGAGSENISVMKVSDDACRLAISGIKLVPCIATRLVDDFNGISITTPVETVSMTKAMIEDGKYIQPLENGTYTQVGIKVIGAHPQYEYIKVNGEDASANNAVNIDVNVSGETSVNIEIKLLGKTAKTYKLILWKEYGTNTYTQRVAGSVGNLTVPVSVDYSIASGKDAKYIKNNGDVAGFAIKEGTVDIIEDGAYYRVLAWKPGFNFHINGNNTSTKLYASNSQSYRVNTGSEQFAGTIDWTGTEGEWVSLGAYKLNKNGISDYCVSFTGNSEAYTMLNEVKYLKLTDGFLIDGDFYTQKAIDDAVIYTGSDSVSITPLFGESEAVIKVNGETAPNNTALACGVTDGLNRIKLNTESKEYNFAVVKSGSVISHNDSVNVSYKNTSDLGVTSAGYNSVGVRALTDDVATVSVPAGEAKLYVWFDVLTGDAASMGNSVTVKAKSDNKTVTVTDSGWYEIGEYAFSAGDKVTIEVTSENLALFSAVKLESSANTFDVTKPVVEIGETEVNTAKKGNAAAWIYAYNGTEQTENASLFLAIYEKNADESLTLLNCVVKDAELKSGFNVIATDNLTVTNPEKTVIKAFLCKTENYAPVTSATNVAEGEVETAEE